MLRLVLYSLCMPNEESSVEKMKKSLYDRNKKPKLKDRRTLHKEEHEVSDSWGGDDVLNTEDKVEMSQEEILEELRSGHIPGDDTQNVEEHVPMKTKKKWYGVSGIIKILFGMSFLFFVFALIFAAYFLFGGKNQVSCENIDFKILGPNTIASGKNLILDISVKNNNPVVMKDAYLEVLFPDGTRNAEITSISMPSVKKEIGTINVNEKVRTTVQAILFGQEQTDNEITATVHYKIDDSDAEFSCEEKHRVHITTSPISLSVQGLEEISSGQDLDLEISVTSNSEETVPDIRLVADYPFGFEFISSEPEPTSGNNVWDMGDIPQGIVKTLKLHGVIKGHGTESREIIFSVGNKDQLNDDKLASTLQKVEHSILVTKPFLLLSLELDGSSDNQVVANVGDEINGLLKWKNTLDSALHDVEIDAVFEGTVLDLASVNSGTGFFRSIDKTIIWTPQTIKKFRKLEAGEEGTLSFKFKTTDFNPDTSVGNPTLNIKINARARRISDNIEVPQSLKDQSKRIVMLNTDLMFDAYAVYAVGPFKNTGPHPPRVDKETTYTVVLNIKNTTNDLSSVVVKGELPINVKWVNLSKTDDGSITFNPVTREVTWSVGDVQRSTGYQTNSRIAYFQVSTIPSISQLGDEIVLLKSPTIRGIDSFTKDVIKHKSHSVGTKLEKDPYFKDVWGLVQ